MQQVQDNHLAIGFIRVSTDKQLFDGGSINEQRNLICKFAKKEFGITEEQIYFPPPVSESGTKINSHPIDQAIRIVKQYPGQFKYVFVRHLDRGTRLWETFKKKRAELEKLGVKVYDADGKHSYEIINDLEDYGVSFGFSKRRKNDDIVKKELEEAEALARKNLLVMFEKNLSYVLRGFAGKQDKYGYVASWDSEKYTNGITDRCVYLPHPTEAFFVKEIFKQKIEGILTDEAIVNRINKLGYKSRIKKRRSNEDKTKVIGTIGGGSLTIKRMNEIVFDPEYAGVNNCKWLRENAIKKIGPMKFVFPGLVTIKEFNLANRGKVVITETPEEDNEFQKNKVRIDYNIPDWRINKKTGFNPNYPYKAHPFVVCPVCGHKLLGSAPKGKRKHYAYYHCKFGQEHKNRTPKEWRIKKDALDQAIIDYFKDIKFTDEFKQYLTKNVLAKIYQNRIDKSNYEVKISQVIADKEVEKQHLLKNIGKLSLTETINEVEKQISQINEEIRLANIDLNKVKNKQEDNTLLTKQIIYFIEHLPELLIYRDYSFINPEYFDSIFEVPPTAEDFINRTPKLNRLFALNEDFKKSLNPSCAQKRT